MHGGAIPVERLGFEPGLAERDRSQTEAKDRIAAAALPHLVRASTVLLDAGSTTARVAAQLPEDTTLTVLTTSPPVATALAARPRLTVVLLGGRVRPTTLATVGPWTLTQLEALTVDVAVVGTNGITPTGGLTTPDPDEAAVKAAMVGSARWVVAVADHTKFGTDRLVRFAGLDAVDVVVTDTGLDDETADAVAAAGPEVVRA